MYYEYDMKKGKKNQLQIKYRLVGKNDSASIERWSRSLFQNVQVVEMIIHM